MRPMPKTPFATRLTGTARELRLRIQNIIQGDKKRSPLLLVVPVLLAAALCGSLVAFTAPEPEPAEPPTPAVSGAEDVSLPVYPDAPEPEPEPEPDPESALGPPSLPPGSMILARSSLTGGTAYVCHGEEYYSTLYWQTDEETVCVDTKVYQTKDYSMRTVSVLGLDCLEVRCSNGQYSGIILYDLEREDRVPSRVFSHWGNIEKSYEDVDGDGILEILLRGFDEWYDRTPGGRCLWVEGSWTVLPGEGWLTDELTVDGRTFQMVTGEKDVLYWLDRGVRKELGRYPDFGDIWPGYVSRAYDCADGGYGYVLGHRVIGVYHSLGTRHMLDFYTVDTPEPMFLLSIDREATQLCDLDGDGFQEMILDAHELYDIDFCPVAPYGTDTEPFWYIYARGPEGQPVYADLFQLLKVYAGQGMSPAELVIEHMDRCYFDDNGNLMQGRYPEQDAILFTGREILELIGTANAWSDQVPTWKDIADLAGPRFEPIP